MIKNNSQNALQNATPEMKHRHNEKSRQLLERVKPKDSREKQSIEFLNSMN
jgi:hypothetical protein